jgi:hypothetical protein
MAEVAHHGVVEEVEPGVFDGFIRGTPEALSIDSTQAGQFVLAPYIASKGPSNGNVRRTILSLTVLPDVEGFLMGLPDFPLKVRFVGIFEVGFSSDFKGEFELFKLTIEAAEGADAGALGAGREGELADVLAAGTLIAIYVEHREEGAEAPSLSIS